VGCKPDDVWFDREREAFFVSFRIRPSGPVEVYLVCVADLREEVRVSCGEVTVEARRDGWVVRTLAVDH
jgi:hypothetical protein